jgi:hypothetical protein
MYLNEHYKRQTTMSKSGERPPMIPFYKLPFFDDIRKRDEWFSLIPDILYVQDKWIWKVSKNLKLHILIRPYFDYAVHLWRESIIMSGNDHSYFAVHSLRAVLERVALTYTSIEYTEIDIESVGFNAAKSTD